MPGRGTRTARRSPTRGTSTATAPTDSTEPAPSHTYTSVGTYTARLTVTDADDRTAVSNLDHRGRQHRPRGRAACSRRSGGFFEFGDTDRATRSSSPTRRTGRASTATGSSSSPRSGHDEHAHGYEQYRGCSGTLPLPGDEGHTGANIFGTITATYTDDGAAGAAPLDGQDTVVLRTKRTEAEYFDVTGRLPGSTSSGAPGVTIENTSDTAGGGKNVGLHRAGRLVRLRT